MRAVQHVFRRGDVYRWRRRLLKKAGESGLAPIALSLGTRELSKARTIAAHLAVASDGILRQEGRDVLSPIQVRAMLESMARTHLAKLDRLANDVTPVVIENDGGQRFSPHLRSATGVPGVLSAFCRVRHGEAGLCFGAERTT